MYVNCGRDLVYQKRQKTKRKGNSRPKGSTLVPEIYEKTEILSAFVLIRVKLEFSIFQGLFLNFKSMSLLRENFKYNLKLQSTSYAVEKEKVVSSMTTRGIANHLSIFF